MVKRPLFAQVGGFIIRNTWADGLGTAHGLKARGSHSAAFFSQTVGDFDEALNCPNPHRYISLCLCIYTYTPTCIYVFMCMCICMYGDTFAYVY